MGTSDYDSSSYSPGGGVADPYPVILAKLIGLAAGGALLTWGGWVGVHAAATFSLVWFLSVLIGIVGLVMMAPLTLVILAAALFILVAAVIVAAVLGVIYLIFKVIYVVLVYFWNHLY